MKPLQALLALFACAVLPTLAELVEDPETGLRTGTITVNGQTYTIEPNANLSDFDWGFADFTGADLSFADLSGSDLGDADLSNVDLRGANLSGADLSDADLSGADLSLSDLSGADLSFATLSSAKLSGANLSSADLHEAYNLNEANFRAANLNGVDLSEADLSNADFTGADLTETNLSEANLSGAKVINADLSLADLSGANLSDAILRETELMGATIQGLNLAGAVMWGVGSGYMTGTPSVLPARWSLINGYLIGPSANLWFAELVNQDLTGVDLTGADLTGADLTGADLTGADLTETDLSFVVLSDVSSGNIVGAPSVLPAKWLLFNGYLVGPESNLVEADLSGADLAHADLSGLDLSFADFTGADLSFANLTGTDLSFADLTGVDFFYANLTGSDLGSSDVTDAIFAGADLANADLEEVFPDQTPLNADETILRLKDAIARITSECDRATEERDLAVADKDVIAAIPEFHPLRHSIYARGGQLRLTQDSGDESPAGNPDSEGETIHLELSAIQTCVDASFWNSSRSEKASMAFPVAERMFFRLKPCGVNIRHIDLSVRPAVIEIDELDRDAGPKGNLLEDQFMDKDQVIPELEEDLLQMRISLQMAIDSRDNAIAERNSEIQRGRVPSIWFKPLELAQEGAVLIRKNAGAGTFDLKFNVETSRDLTTWQPLPEKLCYVIPAEDDQQFLRYHFVDKWDPWLATGVPGHGYHYLDNLTFKDVLDYQLAGKRATVDDIGIIDVLDTELFDFSLIP